MSASYDVDTLVPTASQDFATHTLGPPFAGWIAQTFFTGVLTTWAFQYVRSEAHQNDRRATKVLLYAVLLLAWAQEVVTITLVMHYGTYQKRDSTTLYAQTAMDCLSTLFVGFEGALVQFYLAHRVAKVVPSRPLRWFYMGMITLTCLLGLTGALLYLALSLILRASNGEIQQVGALTFNVATGIWLWAAAFTDVAISLSMMLALKKRMVGFSIMTDSVLKRIVLVGTESASYTAIVALLGSVLNFAFPDASLNANSSLAFWPLLAPFYALSLLNILDSRSKIAGMARSFQVRTPTMFSPQLQAASTLQAECGLHFDERESWAPAGVFVVKEVAMRVDEEKDGDFDPTFTIASVPQDV